jgi:Mce-associated membrane protein
MKRLILPTKRKQQLEDPKEHSVVPTPIETALEITSDFSADPADKFTTADDRTDAATDDVAVAEESHEAAPDLSAAFEKRRNWFRIIAFGLIPTLALSLAVLAGYLKWVSASARSADTARIESVQTAKDSTIALLTYQPDTVEQQLGAARDLLTGEFQNSYTSLIHDVVIPGAKQQRISATANVPAASSVSADPNDAVVLLFVNQTAVSSDGVPTDTASTVRITMKKLDGRWLVSAFDPI